MASTAADENRLRSFEELIAEEGLLPLARTVDLVGQIAETIAAVRAEGGAVDCLEPRAILVIEEPLETPGGGTRTRVTGILRSVDLPVRPGGPRASYFAPEHPDQATAWRDPAAAARAGARVSEQAQQFSLAAIAYEMLAGCPAFPEEIGDVGPFGPTEAERGRGWSRPLPPPVSEQVMGVSNGLDQVLRRALSVEPNQRYAGIGDFMSALREVSDPGAVWDDGATVIWSPAAGDMEPPVPPPLDDYVPPLRRRRTTAKIRALRLDGAARFVKAAADKLVARTRDQSLRSLMRKSRSTTATAGAQAAPSLGGPLPGAGSATTSAVTPMAFASFPTAGMPSRRTQIVFLGAAVVLVLGAVVVMSGARAKPVTDSAAAENAAAEAEPIRPRPRGIETRPLLPRPSLTQSGTAIIAQNSASAAVVPVADPPRRTAKPARAHSRRGGGHRAARR